MSTKASEEESHHDESDITDEFIDDDGDKSGYFPGKTITLQMLLGANVLQPGKGAMSIEYLGQKFIGDLLADGKIKSHETETIFCSPSAWAIYCKRIINPDKRSSGCGWASVKYKGKKLDAYKAAYHRKLLQKEKEDHKDDGPDVEIIEDTEEDKTAMEPPPVRRNVVQHNTISNRNILHDANTLIESVPFTSVGKIQPFLLSVSSSTILLMDFHCHLTNNEVCGYLGGTWDINAHNLSITHAFPCRNSRFDRDKAAMCELQIQKLMVKKNLHLVGWYHSHPRFPVQPTLRDCDAQLEYQIKMRGPTEASYTPCVGFICSPYNDVNNALESSILSFWVLPPPENRPAEYGRPMLMSYSLVPDETLSEDIKEEMMLTVDYYKQFNRELINFQGIYKNEVSYIDKLKKTLAPKLPLDSRSGHFWNWIRELLGLDPEEIVVIPDPPPPPPPVVPKLPEPISGGSSMVVNLTGPDEGSVGTDTKNDEDFDGVSEMGDSDVISLKDDDNKAVSLGVPSLQAQLKRPSGLNMTPSPLSSSLVVLPTNLSQANPLAVANTSNNHGGSITTNTSSPRDSPITIPSNSASPAKFEIPVRASPSPAKSDTSSCRSRTRNSPAPSPVKLSIGDILGSGNRNSPTLSSLIGNMGGNVSNIHDLYAATFASLGTSIPSNLLSQDYASLFQNTKRDEYGLSALNALAQVAAASGISNTQINETLLHSLNRSIGSSSSSGKSGQTSTVTTSSATMSSSTAPSASSSSSAAASSAAAAAAAAAAVASSTGLPPIPNMKEFMQQLEKGNLSLLMQSQYANPLAGMTGLTGQAGSGGTSSGKSGSSRSSGKSRSKAAQAQQAQQQQLQQAQQQLLQQQQQQHQSLMDYADFTSKFDQGKLADLMKSPEYSQMLLQQAQALGSLGSEISIIKKPSSKGNSNNSSNNSGNNNSSNNTGSNNAGNNNQSTGNKKDSASDLITKLRTIFSTDSYLPPMPTAADINLLAEQSQKVPEIQQILNSGNLDDIQVLLKAQSLSNNTLDFALFMQGTSGTNAGAGEGSSKAAKSAAAKEEREREREREREQRERDNANAAAAAAAAAAMNPYLSASNLSALFEPVQRTTSEKSGGKSSKNKGGNTGSQTNSASNPAEMLNSLFTSAVSGTSAADMNALLYGQGKGAPDLSMLFGGVSSAATTSSTSSTTSTAAAAAAAAKQSLDYLSMFPNFSAAKLPEMSALFQSDKFEIPDPLAKATLEANNMYLAPSASLLKLQQEAFNSMMMKPPKSSSSSTSSSSKIETPPPIVASPGARSTPTKSANRDSPSLPKYNFSAVDLAVSSVPLAASSPLGGVADLSRKTPQTPPVDMSASPSISSTPPVSGGSASSQILPPYKKRMEFSSIADLVAAPPSKMPKMSTENLDP